MVLVEVYVIIVAVKIFSPFECFVVILK